MCDFEFSTPQTTLLASQLGLSLPQSIANAIPMSEKPGDQSNMANFASNQHSVNQSNAKGVNEFLIL